MDISLNKISEVFMRDFGKNALITFVLLALTVRHLYGILKWLESWLSLFYRPMNYERDMTTESYCKEIAEVDNTFAAKSKFNDIEELIQPNDCKIKEQQLYPNGWLPLIESAKVSAGQLKRAMIVGRDVIVSRSMEGTVSVLDAYCPHMGVHIGIGGKVVSVNGESCVQCPFHSWSFRASDGQCVEIPYLNRKSKTIQEKCDLIPKQAKLNTWQCCEVDNFIYIWHHIDNEPPNWWLDSSPELSPPGNLSLAGRSYHKFYSETSDFLENGADVHHFDSLHGGWFIFDYDITQLKLYKFIQKFILFNWSLPNWSPILDDKNRMTHKAELKFSTWIEYSKFNVTFLKIEATQIGPASAAVSYHIKWLGSGLMKLNVIRSGGRQTEHVEHIYTQNNILSKLIAMLFLHGQAKQLERDVLIWNHKKYLTNPVLVPEDKLVKRFRQWFAQFYKRKIVIE